MTPSQQGEFPKFADGDVTIVVSTSKIYKLHSHVLRPASEYFKNMFDGSEAPRIVAAARRKGYTPWKFVLVQDPIVPDERGQFISLPVSESGRVPPQFNVPPRAPGNTLGGEDEDRYWDWLFASLYGESPKFDESTFGATVHDCDALLDIAESIRAAKHVREVVDLALIRQDEFLWKSIANDPSEWAKLGQRVQSPTIFKEAVIHMVGKWKWLNEDVKQSLPEELHKLCQRKWDELELIKRAKEIRIAGHYPPFLCRNHADKPHRSAYSNDIYMWMSLAYFRQYLSQSGNDSQNRQAEDGGYQWYKQLSEGGDSYLDRDYMRRFHQYFPMSAKACTVMEAHMKVLKEEVKEFVRELMVVRTHIDPGAMEGVERPWLTCTIVENEDLPWHVVEDEDQRMSEEGMVQMGMGMGMEHDDDAGSVADDEEDLE